MKVCMLFALMFSSLAHSMEKTHQADTVGAQQRKLSIINHLSTQIIVIYKEAKEAVFFVINPHSTYEHTIEGEPYLCQVRHTTFFSRENVGFAPDDVTDSLRRFYFLHTSAGIKLHVDVSAIPFLTKLLPSTIWFNFDEGVLMAEGKKLITPGMKVHEAFVNNASTDIRELLGLEKNSSAQSISYSKIGFVYKWQPVLYSENNDHAEFAKKVIDQDLRNSI